MSDINGRIGGHTPTLSFLDGPLLEDMLHITSTGLTKAVVTGPGRAVLFYVRHSMGEGLMVDKARDATFLLTGAGTWVGKSAYPTTDPMTIQEGKRAIAQAILDNRVKARGPGCPHVNLLAQQPFWFNAPRTSPPKDASVDCGSDYPPSPHWPSRGWEHIEDRETRGLNHLGFLHLPQTMVLRVIGVHYQQHLWCCPDLNSQMDQGISDEVDDTKKKHAWR